MHVLINLQYNLGHLNFLKGATDFVKFITTVNYNHYSKYRIFVLGGWCIYKNVKYEKRGYGDIIHCIHILQCVNLSLVNTIFFE